MNNELFTCVSDGYRVQVRTAHNGTIVYELSPPRMGNDRIASVSADNQAQYVTVALTSGHIFIYRKSGARTWVIDRQYYA